MTGVQTCALPIFDKRGFSAKSDVVEIVTKPLNYNVKVVIKDSITNEFISTCNVTVNDQTKLTDAIGEVYFNQVSGLMDIQLESNKYYSKTISQLSIYNDTTLVYYLAQKKSKVVIIVHDNYNGNTFEGTQVVFNSKQQITNLNGEAFFEVYIGSYDYSVVKNSFQTETGIVEVNSDTTFQIFMTRTEAEIKFVVKEGTTPVNNATVIVNTDTLNSTSLGIARFKGLSVSKSYDYLIYKSGYNDVSGIVFLQTDTTINITIESIPVGIDDVLLHGNLKIWPNPVDRILSLTSSENIKSISVYNLSGSKINVGKTISSKISQLDFSTVEPGAYLLEINFENSHTSFRKIIRH